MGLEDASSFVCKLANDKVPFSEISKIRPGLTLLHETQGHKSRAAVQERYVQLLILGAKREAAKRRGNINKADCLSKAQVTKMVNDILFSKDEDRIDKVDARIAVKGHVMYKTWARYDGYKLLTVGNIIIDDESVTV